MVGNGGGVYNVLEALTRFYTFVGRGGGSNVGICTEDNP